MQIPAILLAAGASRRLGQPKQLIAVDGETLLARTLRIAIESDASPVVCVLGAYQEAIRAAVSLDRALVVTNPAWETGMATSLHAGLRALASAAPEAPAVLMLTCDQPRLTAGHLRALLAAFRAAPAPSIVASAYSGIAAVPAVLPRLTFPDLLALRGDRGARAILAAPPCPLLTVDFPGGAFDIDTSGDRDRLGS